MGRSGVLSNIQLDHFYRYQIHRRGLTKKRNVIFKQTAEIQTTFQTCRDGRAICRHFAELRRRARVAIHRTRNPTTFHFHDRQLAFIF